jgi:hypothetical protein
MIRSCSFAFLAVGATCLSFSGTSGAQSKPHPHIHHALYELREARDELKKAAHNFGGHRKAALKEVQASIDQLKKALVYSGDKRPFKGDPKADYYKKYATYPHIRHAVHELKATVDELKAASHNYGGHRKLALERTQAAIRQLEKCIEFANSKK